MTTRLIHSVLAFAAFAAASPAPGQSAAPADDPAKLVDAGRYVEAIERLAKSASSTAPESPDRVPLGRAYAGAGRYDEAESSLAAAAAPALEADRLATLARVAEARGKADRALDLMAQAVAALRKALGGRDLLESAVPVAELLADRGEIAFRAGRLDEAAAAYQEAAKVINAAHMRMHELDVPHDERDPRIFAGRAAAGLADVYAARGDLARAERAWKSVAPRVSSPILLARAASFFAVRGDEATARKILARLDAKPPADRPGRRAVALSLADRSEGLDRALSLAEADFRAGPDVPARDTLAWVLHRRGEHARADEVLRPALEAGTRDPLVLFHAGMIARALGRDAEARERFARALEINPAFEPAAARAAKDALGKTP